LPSTEPNGKGTVDLWHGIMERLGTRPDLAQAS
jgi:hypothetical protein